MRICFFSYIRLLVALPLSLRLMMCVYRAHTYLAHTKQLRKGIRPREMYQHFN